MMSNLKMTTPGEWIVSTNQLDQIVVNALSEKGSVIKTVAIFGHINIEGEDESTANAAILAVSKDMPLYMMEAWIQKNCWIR